MKRIFPLLVVLLVSLVSGAGAEFLGRRGPTTVEGKIVRVTWEPELKKAGQPGMSGTMDSDRTFPARYIVVIENPEVSGQQTEDFVQTGKNLFPSESKEGRTALVINHGADDGFLKEGQIIKVEEYKDWGDEGGILSEHGKVDILASESSKAP